MGLDHFGASAIQRAVRPVALLLANTVRAQQCDEDRMWQLGARKALAVAHPPAHVRLVLLRDRCTAARARASEALTTTGRLR